MKLKRLLILYVTLILLFGTISSSTVKSADRPKVEWEKTFGGDDKESAYQIIQTDDGGYLVIGDTESYGAGKEDFWILKLSAKGSVEWNKTFGEEGYEVPDYAIQTIDGGYAVVGHTTSYSDGLKDGWIVKIDSDGDLEWDKHYGGANNEVFHFIDQTKNGDYIVLGYTSSFGDQDNMWYLKLDKNGEIDQNKTFGREFDGFNDATKTKDDGYVLTGWYKKEGDDTYNSYLIKIDISGEVEWTKIYSDSSDYLATSVIQTSDNGYAIAGRVKSSENDEDSFMLMKTDDSGKKKWTRSLGGDKTDKAWDLIQTDDGDYVIVGMTYSFDADPYTDLLLIKTDSSGQEIWNQTFGGEKGDCGYSIIETDDGNLMTAGRTRYNSDCYILKFKDDSIDNEDVDQNSSDTPFITSMMFFIITIFISIIMMKRK